MCDDIDGSYLSVARSMPFDKLLELENKSIPSVDFIVESKYTQKNINKYITKCMTYMIPGDLRGIYILQRFQSSFLQNMVICNKAHFKIFV